jgi:hypothetical protein
MDALQELIEHVERERGLSPMLRRIQRFHTTNPQVLDFVVQELWDTRASGWSGASVKSIWEYARWVLTRKYRAPGESFVMSNNLHSYYARIIVILHPDLNGFFEMIKSKPDADFGTMLEPASKANRPGYVRRLLWADGTPIEQGWRPSTLHEPKPVPRRERVTRKVMAKVSFSKRKRRA